MKKQDVLNRVLNSESSIFSKDDVIRLIELVEGEGKTVTVTDIGAVIDDVMDNLDRRNHTLFNKDTAEFNLRGNEIELEEVEIELNLIRNVLEEHLMPLGEVDLE